MRVPARVAVLVAALLAVFVVPASASIRHDPLFDIEGAATPAGDMDPQAVAVDNSGSPSAGKLYVVDARHKVVNRFSNTGVYECQITGGGTTSGVAVSDSECDPSTDGTASGAFGDLYTDGIAVDPSNGDLYVGDLAEGTLKRFDADGSLIAEIALPSSAFRSSREAVAVDTQGNVLLVDAPSQVVRKYDTTTGTWSVFASGTPSGAFGSQLTGVAVDTNLASPGYGSVYVADGYPNQAVYVFDSSGIFVGQRTSPSGGNFTDFPHVGTDPTTGDLYVTDFSDYNTVRPSGVLQFDATGTLRGRPEVPDTGGTHASVQAVAVGAQTRHIYVSGGTQVHVFGEGYIVPDVEAADPSAISPSGATLHGTVNPDGVAVTECYFEYGTDTSYGNTAPCAESVGGGTTPVSVHADISGLSNDTNYHFRLVASNADGSTASGDRSFATPPPPSISGARSANLDSSSADLIAQVNPQGLATTYHFEYGTDTSYGASVPVPDGDLGSGTSPVTVGAHLTGLSPNTTYHWRVVAENVSGTTTTRDHTFIYDTGGSPLPDDRAYEQVTPVQKNGAAFDTGILIAPPRVGDSGDRVMLTSIQCFPGSGACPVNNRSLEGALYSSERTSAGWQTTELTPPVSVFAGSSTRGMMLDSGASVFASSKFNDSKTDLVARRGDGTFVTIGPAQAPGTNLPAAYVGLARFSDDLSRTVFLDQASKLGWPFDQTFGNRSTMLEYVGSGNSEPFLVAVTGGRGSTDLIGHCGVNFGPIPSAGSFLNRSVSRDGRTIYVTVEDVSACPPGTPGPLTDELYARIDESRTVKISARSPEGCTTSSCVSSPASDALFEAASDDGSKALFSSEQQLTDDATEGEKNLYLYDFDRPAGDELTAISAGSQGGGGPDVRGVLAYSPDGSHTYFVAGGVLDSERNAAGETPTAGANNLYLYKRDSVDPNGRLTYIAQLADTDLNWGLDGANSLTDVTPTGRFMLFPSRVALTADGASANEAAQIYRYDAATKEMVRVSVGEGGFNDDGDGGGPPPCVPVPDPGGCPADANIPQVTGRAMSRDGQYVFFSSPAALTPGATDYVPTGALADAGNGDTTPYYRQNVYEWHDGHVYLIADGRGAPSRALGSEDGVLLGTDATGKNVFFKSDAALSASDTDNGQRDIYTARVCSDADPCIQPPPTATACAGDACQGSQSGAPAPPVAGTVGFAGPGNATGRPARLRATLLTKLARGSRFVVRVRVPAKGRIAVRGAAVKTARRRAARAGTHRVVVKLTRKARRSLARKRKLRIALSVRYAPASGAGSTSRVMLIVSAPKTRGGGR